MEREEWAEAEPFLRECLAIQGAGPDGWGSSHVRSLLRAGPIGQGRYAEAEPPLVAGYEWL